MLAMKEVKQQTTDLDSPNKKGHSAPDGAHQQMANPALFLQRNLGNSYVQSMAGGRQTVKQTTAGSGAPTIQRTCACGGAAESHGACEACRNKYSPVGRSQAELSENKSGISIQTFASDGETGTIDPETGAETVTSTCCPLHEDEAVSHRDRFTVFDRGAQPTLGGTQAIRRFEYDGASDNVGPFCACDCCSFVQFVRGFFEINGKRESHTLPGSGAAMSATTFGQDSPILKHGGCRVATVGGGLLNDTPGARGISSTDVLNIHLEFDARIIDTCTSNNIVASRLFTLDITGAHPRTFSVSGDAV